MSSANPNKAVANQNKEREERRRFRCCGRVTFGLKTTFLEPLGSQNDGLDISSVCPCAVGPTRRSLYLEVRFTTFTTEATHLRPVPQLTGNSGEFLRSCTGVS